MLSNFAAAFLRRDDKYLLMKRGANREIAPDVLSGIGGKIESAEINNPFAACIREVYEETGITAGQIHNLTLRYIIVRRCKNVIRQSYIYFGETSAEPSIKTDEGELHWVPECELLNHTFSVTFKAMLEHFVHTPNEKDIVVGVAENENGKCHMVWSALDDFEGN